MMQMWFGYGALILGLILAAMAGYGYYEDMGLMKVGQKSSIDMKLYQYRMWIAIAGIVLFLLGGGMVWYDMDAVAV